MDKELACWLQAKEEVAEEAQQGRDAVTLEVVMEAARPLTRGHWKVWGSALDKHILRQLGRAACPWL